MINPAYQVKVKQSIELLKQLLHQADDAAWLVLAGNLSQCRTHSLTGVVREALPREEIPVENEVYHASYGRLSIPLSGSNKYALKKEVLPFINMRTHIQTVTIQRYGRMLFTAQNYFKDAVFNDWFNPEFLRDLEQAGVIQIAHRRPQSAMAIRRNQTGMLDGRYAKSSFITL
ncbi:MAG: hypothetical protein HF973_01170 [Chloroflexi bacterium]|nr:hypothetical protein [Chloroflexota bacterium]